jgi:hypothetical protein
MNASVAEILSDQPAGFAQVSSLAGDVESVYHHVTQSAPWPAGVAPAGIPDRDGQGSDGDGG